LTIGQIYLPVVTPPPLFSPPLFHRSGQSTEVNNSQSETANYDSRMQIKRDTMIARHFVRHSRCLWYSRRQEK